MYDEHCIQFDCNILEESDSDSETWPHQNIPDIKEEHEDIKDESEEANGEDIHEEADEKNKSKTTVLQKDNSHEVFMYIYTPMHDECIYI